MNPFDCEIETNDDTISRGIAGYKGKILERDEREVIIKLWMDDAWGEPRRVKPEEIREL